jgi:hypothetical protein
MNACEWGYQNAAHDVREARFSVLFQPNVFFLHHEPAHCHRQHRDTAGHPVLGLLVAQSIFLDRLETPYGVSVRFIHCPKTKGEIRLFYPAVVSIPKFLSIDSELSKMHRWELIHRASLCCRQFPMRLDPTIQKAGPLISCPVGVVPLSRNSSI